MRWSMKLPINFGGLQYGRMLFLILIPKKRKDVTEKSPIKKYAWHVESLSDILCIMILYLSFVYSKNLSDSRNCEQQ